MLVDSNYESLSKHSVYSEIAGEVGTLVCYAPIEKEWRRQVYIALIRLPSLTVRYKMRGLVDLPYAYLTLAALHDYFDLLKPIITSELQELQKDFHIGVSPLFCKNCLREIRNDLMQRGLLTDARIQLSRQVENLKEPVEEANKKELLELVSKLAKSAVSSGEADLENKDSRKLTGRSTAIILLKEHPDWKDNRIAKEAGVNRSSLYRWPEYKLLRQLLLEERSLPRGSKNKDGSIEAIAEE